MNRKQIEAFIEKVYPDEPVGIKYYRDTSPSAFSANCDIKNKVIYFNRYYLQRKSFRMCDNVWTKTLILHELGHVAKGRYRSWAKAEFMAQKWGIELADKLGLEHEMSEMLTDLKDWAHIKWNDPNRFRRYRLAYRLALKDRKWAKKSGLIV